MLIFALEDVHADGRLPYPSKALGVRADGSAYLNLVKGIFARIEATLSSTFLISPVTRFIPSKKIPTKQRNLSTKSRNGQVPSIFGALPQEAVHQFQAVINNAPSLSDELKIIVEAAGTDAVNDIEDGTITIDIKNLPGFILSDLTSGWQGSPTSLPMYGALLPATFGAYSKIAPGPQQPCPAVLQLQRQRHRMQPSAQNTQIAPYPAGTTRSSPMTSTTIAATCAPEYDSKATPFYRRCELGEH